MGRGLLIEAPPELAGRVDKVLPDYRERQEWLRENGAGMKL
ncbi:MAG: M48 family metallopeptidase [Chloroflexi bacterium]|nr:M48 family metallopeptidase [Chloroflexota bacterium]